MKTTDIGGFASPWARLFAWRLFVRRDAETLARRPLRWGLFCPLAFALGAAAYFTAPAEPSWAMIAAGGGFTALAAALLDDRPVMRVLSMLILIACLGAGIGKARTSLTDAPRIYTRLGPVALEGVVSSIEAGDRGERLRIRVHAIEGLERQETPKWVRITHRQDLRIRPGRSLRCRAILSPPPGPGVPGDYDFQRQAYFQQLGAVGFALGACRPAPARPALNVMDHGLALLGAARRAVAEHVFEASGASPGGGVAAAMTSGDRSFIAPSDAEALRAAGLAHLLAISGLHMGLAGGVFFFAIRRLWPLFEPLALRAPAPKVAAVAALAACTGYLALSGASVATQRAYVMAATALLAVLLDRPALTLRLLALAMGAVTLLQPETTTTPGFHMSFAATAALIALYEAWPRSEGPWGAFTRARRWTSSLTATSVVASLATGPFAAFHFGRAAVLGVPANLAAMPIISLWTAPAGGIAAAASVLNLSEPFFAAMAVSLDMVLFVARTAEALGPPETLAVMPAESLLLFVLGVAVACVFRSWGRFAAAPVFVVAMTMWTTAMQPILHIAADATVYVRVEGEWRAWRPRSLEGRRGLKPLAIEAVSPTPACATERPICEVKVDWGVIILGDPQTEDAVSSPQAPYVRFIPTNGDIAPAMMTLDAAAARGGVSLLADAEGRRLRYGHPQGSTRPWRN